jgi:hypothetical protein
MTTKPNARFFNVNDACLSDMIAKSTTLWDVTRLVAASLLHQMAVLGSIQESPMHLANPV